MAEVNPTIIKVGGSGWGYAVLGLTIVAVGGLIYWKLKGLNPLKKVEEVADRVKEEIKDYAYGFTPSAMEDSITQGYPEIKSQVEEDTQKLQEYGQDTNITPDEQKDVQDIVNRYAYEKWLESVYRRELDNKADTIIKKSLDDELVKEYSNACERYGACM